MKTETKVRIAEELLAREKRENFLLCDVEIGPSSEVYIRGNYIAEAEDLEELIDGLKAVKEVLETAESVSEIIENEE